MIIYYGSNGSDLPLDKKMMLPFADPPSKKLRRIFRETQRHFLDSGAFTMWTKAAEYAQARNCDKWAYYDRKGFWQYADCYVNFVKKHRVSLYANLDAIPNPDLTWRNQQYLEKQGIRPIPIIHNGTDTKWIEKYINDGHTFLGFGAVVGSEKYSRRCWLDRAFRVICPDGKPIVKVHGFGVTDHLCIIRYPWWSIDNTTWIKRGGYGAIIIPRWRNGKFVYAEQPHSIVVSKTNTNGVGCNYLSLTRSEKSLVHKWLERIGIAFEKVAAIRKKRIKANVLYFEELRKTIPEWPWKYTGRKVNSLLA